VTFAAIPCAAQTEAHTFELGISSSLNPGYAAVAEPFAEGLIAAGWNSVRVDREAIRSWLVGLTAAANLSRFVALVGETMFSDLGSSTVSGRVGASARTTVELRPWALEWSGGLRARVPTGYWRVQPFIGAGIGTTHLKVRASGSAATASASERFLTVTYAAGLSVYLTRHLGVGVDHRQIDLGTDRVRRSLVHVVFAFE
jgi:hypothetical protein